MDQKTYQGSLAEAKVIAELTKQGYEIFVSLSGKSSCDLVAIKDKVFRVQVKSVAKAKTNGSYEIQLRSVRHNTKTTTVSKFDSSKCDMLAIYVVPIDKVVILDPQQLDNRATVTINGSCPAWTRTPV